MSELNDRELEELERRLSAAFSGTRPRRGFEDELWARLQRRGSPRGFLRPTWRLPAWPALGALAAVVVIGLTVLAVPQLVASRGGAGSTRQAQTSSTAAQPARPAADGAGAGGAARAQQQPETASGSFGRLPAPVLVPPAGASTVPAGQPRPYYGPAHLTVGAQLPAAPAALPVYRYRQPASADLDAFAASLGASRAGAAGSATIYRSSEFRLDLLPAAAGQEPRFVVSAVATSAGGASSDSRQVADAFLSAHPELRPSWPAAVQAEPGAVLYQRRFDVQGAQAGQVDSAGSPAGLRLQVAGGSVTGASGSLPVTLSRSDYRSRPPQQAASDAVSQPPAEASGPAQVPTFKLSSVSLVYMAVNGGDYGYLVPVYLFTGTANSPQGVLEKRVAVPALDASQLG